MTGSMSMSVLSIPDVCSSERVDVSGACGPSCGVMAEAGKAGGVATKEALHARLCFSITDVLISNMHFEFCKRCKGLISEMVSELCEGISEDTEQPFA